MIASVSSGILKPGNYKTSLDGFPLVCATVALQRDCGQTAPINSRLNAVVRSPTPFGLGRNGCWPSRGSQVPRVLSFIFSLCCPLNDRRRRDLAGQVSAMLHFSYWVHLRCSQLSLSKFRALGSSHFWSFPPSATL